MPSRTQIQRLPPASEGVLGAGNRSQVDRSALRGKHSASAWPTESTIHQLAPYIGKIKSTIAAALVEEYSEPGDRVWDPFSGCGTIAFEAWVAKRRVLASDLSPYALVLTAAKLTPYSTEERALEALELAALELSAAGRTVDLRRVPQWVRDFFHTETLREVVSWSKHLVETKQWFLLASLLGILHHQRPGFLSYPSSHTVPYLRTKKFPPSKFSTLYEYRSVRERLEAKVVRAMRRVPSLDYEIDREWKMAGADAKLEPDSIDSIMTSPPYMRQLDYGRDNRLRLWFLGCSDWRSLDLEISPGEDEFVGLMRRCFSAWRPTLKQHGRCVLVVGDRCSREGVRNLPRRVAQLAVLEYGFTLESEVLDPIPSERRVRRGVLGNLSETILVLRNSRIEVSARQETLGE